MIYVDIIMGVYNEEKYIERAINSIIQQTDNRWRLLICDDGSIDKTILIVEKFISRYPQKIKLYRNDKNMGLTYSLNRLLELTDAKYIARMDADDLSVPERLEKQIQFMEEHKEYAFVGSSIEKFDEIGTFGINMYPETPEKKDFLWNNPFAHPTTMIRRKVLVEAGGYRDIPMTKRCEDYDLWMRLYELGYKGYNIQEPLLLYFENRNSYSKRKFVYRINEFKTRYDGFKRNGLMPKGIIYIFKPFFVSLIPNFILRKIRRNI